jgi:transcriptional regulator with XRE-family HTH domain
MGSQGGGQDAEREARQRAFGGALRRTRRSLDVTQDELAERTGISRNHVSDMERGLVNPTLETLWRLADGLGVHVAVLVDDRPA